MRVPPSRPHTQHCRAPTTHPQIYTNITHTPAPPPKHTHTLEHAVPPIKAVWAPAPHGNAHTTLPPPHSHLGARLSAHHSCVDALSGEGVDVASCITNDDEVVVNGGAEALATQAEGGGTHALNLGVGPQRLSGRRKGRGRVTRYTSIRKEGLGRMGRAWDKMSGMGRWV
jgi:hypothetical protein